MENLLTAKEAAGFLRVSISTLHAWLKVKQLPALRTGRHLKFSKEELYRWAGEQYKEYQKKHDQKTRPQRGPKARKVV